MIYYKLSVFDIAKNVNNNYKVCKTRDKNDYEHKNCIYSFIYVIMIYNNIHGNWGGSRIPLREGAEWRKKSFTRTKDFPFQVCFASQV